MNLTHSVTVVHKLDPAQFTVLAGIAHLLIDVISKALVSDDPAAIAGLTEKLKTSAAGLETALEAAQASSHPK